VRWFSPAVAGDHSALSATTVISTSLDAAQRCLDVTWNDGETTSYPYIWLRDNCQCSTCFHAATLARRLLFHDVDFNVMPVNVEVTLSCPVHTATPDTTELSLQIHITQSIKLRVNLYYASECSDHNAFIVI